MAENKNKSATYTLSTIVRGNKDHGRKISDITEEFFGKMYPISGITRTRESERLLNLIVEGKTMVGYGSPTSKGDTYLTVLEDEFNLLGEGKNRLRFWINPKEGGKVIAFRKNGISGKLHIKKNPKYLPYLDGRSGIARILIANPPGDNRKNKSNHCSFLLLGIEPLRNHSSNEFYLKLLGRVILITGLKTESEIISATHNQKEKVCWVGKEEKTGEVSVLYARLSSEV